MSHKDFLHKTITDLWELIKNFVMLIYIFDIIHQLAHIMLCLQKQSFNDKKWGIDSETNTTMLKSD